MNDVYINDDDDDDYGVVELRSVSEGTMHFECNWIPLSVHASHTSIIQFMSSCALVFFSFFHITLCFLVRLLNLGNFCN